jgi:hypothetical protein
LKEIGDSAFDGSRVETIEIPDECELINGSSLFGLEFVTLPKRSKYLALEDGVLYNTKSKSAIRYFGESSRVLIDNGIESISEKCFWKSHHQVIFGPNSKLKEICCFAFEKSEVKTIEIPCECEFVDGFSLVGLESVTVSKDHKSLVCKDDFLINASKNTLVRYFGKSDSILINNFVENFSSGCFFDCKSTFEIVFEQGSTIKEIGENAFHFSGIRSITIPRSVEKLGFRCFFLCREDLKVFFEEDSKLKEIGCAAFCWSKIQSIEIPKSVEKLDEYCFCGSHLSEITFESSPFIGKSAFEECPVRRVNVAKGVVLEYPFAKNCVIKEIGEEIFVDFDYEVELTECFREVEVSEEEMIFDEIHDFESQFLPLTVNWESIE